MKTLVLFDIDGTLVQGGPAKQAFREAMVATFGTAGDIEVHDFAGKTDPQIARELLSAAGLDPGRIEAGFATLWEQYSDGLGRCLTDHPLGNPGGTAPVDEHAKRPPGRQHGPADETADEAARPGEENGSVWIHASLLRRPLRMPGSGAARTLPGGPTARKAETATPFPATPHESPRRALHTVQVATRIAARSSRPAPSTGDRPDLRPRRGPVQSAQFGPAQAVGTRELPPGFLHAGIGTQPASMHGVRSRPSRLHQAVRRAGEHRRRSSTNGEMCHETLVGTTDIWR
jgi:hypothetical protein